MTLRVNRRLRLLVWALSHVPLVIPCAAQLRDGRITGVVTDPSGAVVTQASISIIANDGKTRTTATDRAGVYTIRGLTPGVYSIKAICNGFAPFEQDNRRLSAGQILRVDVLLNIATHQVTMDVSDTDTDVDISPDKNASALVFRGQDLDALADDPAQLQMQLQAMAGPGSGSDLPEVYVDGFSADKPPSKSAIQEIRINQNPYSAQYDRPGRGRIEIVTKPGTDAFHGGLWSSGNDSSFNSQNPFVSQQQPPFVVVQRLN